LTGRRFVRTTKAPRSCVSWTVAVEPLATGGGGERIWIPGGSFSDLPHTTTRREPARRPTGGSPILSLVSRGLTESVGLIGTVDENDSIIHAFPRMQASIFCNDNDDEACMSVEGQYSGSGLNAPAGIAIQLAVRATISRRRAILRARWGFRRDALHSTCSL